MIFISDFPVPDECVRYHIQDKAPLFAKCDEKHGVQCINGKDQSYNIELSGIYNDKGKEFLKDSLEIG